MNYDENVFKEKANIKARRIWLVFALLLTANYGSDAANGLYPVSNYIIFVNFYNLINIFYISFTDCIYLCASCHKPSGSLQEPQLYDSLRHRQYACHHRQRLIPRCRTWLQLCG